MTNLQELENWARQYLPDGVLLPDSRALAPVNGDAGFRQYFRLNTTPSLIAVFAPPEQENNNAFVKKGLFFAEADVHVPQVHAVDYQHGYLLLEDLGDELLMPQLNSNTVAGLYNAAEAALLDIQRVSCDQSVFDLYSGPMLLQEMGLFPEWFVEQLLGQDLTIEDHELLANTFEHLVISALQQPQVVVHRDYHSRNLLVQSDGTMGVVDFQDAVIGPITYDLVSLLKDCYVRWSPDVVAERALAYLRRQPDLAQESDQQLLKWFDWMGLQRHLKVLGIFARLWLRDSKPQYLNDLPLVVRYTLEVTGRYKELERFHQWFVNRLLPVLPEQSWYQSWEQAGD